jgi:predicted Zn-dependent protease
MPKLAPLVLAACLALCAPGRSGAEDLSALKKAADKVLADPDNVRAAKSAARVFDYADAAAAKGAEAEAADYRQKGLRLDPWNLQELLGLAQWLSKTGQTVDAQVKFETVEKYGETDALKAGALKGLGQDLSWQAPEEAKAVPGKAPVVVLTPLGGVDVWLLQALAQELRADLGIEVQVMDLGVPLGPPARTGRALWLHVVRHDLQAHPDQEKFMVAMAKHLGLDPASLADDDSLYRVLLAVEDQSEQREFAEGLELANAEALKQEGQWDAAPLMKSLQAAAQPFERPGLVVIGVTAKDIYANDNNFLFGNASDGFAVISYRRFSAAETGETPKASRLLLRLHKQALSSVGFGFGVERCTTAWCARSYSNSLEQQDAKDPWLCGICRENFRKAFAKLGWTQPIPDREDEGGISDGKHGS